VCKQIFHEFFGVAYSQITFAFILAIGHYPPDSFQHRGLPDLLPILPIWTGSRKHATHVTIKASCLANPPENVDFIEPLNEMAGALNFLRTFEALKDVELLVSLNSFDAHSNHNYAPGLQLFWVLNLIGASHLDSKIYGTVDRSDKYFKLSVQQR
jgi:hypothetical protein